MEKIREDDFNMDHIVPVVPVNMEQSDMNLEDFFVKQNCKKHNLQILCKACHGIKTKEETSLRAKNRRERKKKEKQS